MPDEATALRALVVEAQNLIVLARAAGLGVTIRTTTAGIPLVRFTRLHDQHPNHPPELRPSGGSGAGPALDSPARLPVYTFRL